MQPNTPSPPGSSSGNTSDGGKDRRCRCGYAIGDPLVHAEPQYNLWGWFLLGILGASATPIRIEYRCTRCRTLLGITRDPSVLKRTA